MGVDVVRVVLLLVCALSLTLVASGVYLVASHLRRRGHREVLEPDPWHTPTRGGW